MATDQDSGHIRAVEVTTADVHDAAELVAILPNAPGPVYGDTASTGSRSEAVICTRGGTPHVTHTSTWGGPAGLARLEAHNAGVRRVRGRIEKVFGTAKRSYGLRRMRWVGLARAGLQVRLVAMAYNLGALGVCSTMRLPERGSNCVGQTAGTPTTGQIEGFHRSKTPRKPQIWSERLKATAIKLSTHRSHYSAVPPSPA